MKTDTTDERPLAYSIDWSDWLDRWDAAKDVIECQGLLHAVFQVRMDRDTQYSHDSEYDDRLILLLKVADVYEYHHGNYKELSRAAFKQLANHFFKYWYIDGGGLRDSERLSFRLILALLHFFRPVFSEDGTGGRIPNLTMPRDPNLKGFEHVEQITASFLDRLCSVIWEVSWFQAPAAIESMLEIWMARNNLLVLLPKKYFKPSTYGYADAKRHWEKFTDRVMGKLDEIALRGAESIEDSLSRGNQAALLLVAAKTGKAEVLRRTEAVLTASEAAEYRERLARI